MQRSAQTTLLSLPFDIQLIWRKNIDEAHKYNVDNVINLKPIFGKYEAKMTSNPLQVSEGMVGSYLYYYVKYKYVVYS